MKIFGMLKKIIIIFVLSSIMSTILYHYSVHIIMPKVIYSNVIQFNLAYLNESDNLLIAGRSNENSDDTVTRINLLKSTELSSYEIHHPFISAPVLYFVFGENKAINFAISDVIINGVLVDTKKLASQLNNIGYKIKIDKNIIFAEPSETFKFGVLNLYDISESFNNIDIKTLNEYEYEDKVLKIYYYLLLLIIFSVIFSILLKKLNSVSKNLDVAFICTHTLLFILATKEVWEVAYKQDLINLFYYLKNYLFICLLPTLLFILTYRIKLTYRILVCILSICYMFFIGFDNFAQNVFGTRFIFSQMSNFAGEANLGFPFFIEYISCYSGQLYLLGILSLVCSYLSSSKTNNKSKVTKQSSAKFKLISVFSLAICCSSLFILVGNTENSKKFFNPFQVNLHGVFTDGDFNRKYEKFSPYTENQLEYSSYRGLNQKKNIIIILVESLSCDMTFLCGNNFNYSPYTAKLAKENVWFPNYYSNAYHTNGSIFAITTGYPYMDKIKGLKNMAHNEKFYNYDMVAKFKSEGYKTAYYTPAEQILGKDVQLSKSPYDYVSSSSDSFYDNKEKKGIFNSVSDEDMYAKIINDLKNNIQQPLFLMLTTISTHTPYITPWGAQNLERAFAYSDMALKKFIDNLKSIDYFSNGVVIITGDHRGWGSENNFNSDKKKSIIDSEQVPLILINGKDHNITVNNSFSHTSLHVMLEYLMLPTYDKNALQINPLTEKKDEVILHPDADCITNVLVKYGNNENIIILDGDNTRFKYEKLDSPELDQLILGYISFLRN